MTERIRVPEGKKKIVLADVSQAADVAARDAADAKLTNEKHVTGSLLSGERWKQIGRNIWKHNLAREYYRQKEIGTAKSAITESGNIYVEEGLDKTKHDAALQAVVQQFSSEAVDDVIHTEVGEKRTKADGLLKDEIFSHIYDFAKNAPSPEGASADLYKMHEANFRQAVLTAARERGGDSLDQGTMFADNLLEMAKDVRANIAHYSGAADLDKGYEVIVGRARMGARTEANYNRTDRMLELMQSNRFTAALASPLVVGALAAAATIAGKAALSRTAAWLTFGVAGVAAGAFAYKQESKRFKEERRQHSREKAVGKEFTKETDSRRAEMDTYSYETQSANELTQTLQDAIEGNDPNEMRGVLAQIDARIRLSDRQNIDLISYSDVSQVAQERLALDIARAEAKVALRDSHGITADVIANDANLTMSDLTKQDGDIQSKDALFNSMRQKRAWKMAAIGTVVGVGAGLVAEEAYAAMSTNRAGLLEAAWGGGGDKMTFAKSLAMYLSGDLPAPSATPLTPAAASALAGAPAVPAALPMHNVSIGGGIVTMPQSYQLSPTSDGLFELKDPSGKTIASGLNFNPNGALDAASKMTLTGVGVQADSTVHTYNTMRSATVLPLNYTAWNPNMVDVQRKFGWQDWGTRHPDFDELGLNGGGKEGAKIVTDTDGNKYYEFSMRGMKREGLARLRNGANFNLLLTVSDDTQSRAFKFGFDPVSGKALVPADSEAGRLLFKEEMVRGSKTHQAVFQGRFAEVAEYKTLKNGTTGQRIWATDTGKSAISSVTTDVPASSTEATNTLTVLPPAASDVPAVIVPPAPTETIESPWLIPVMSRRPLERAERKKLSDSTMAYYYSYGGEGFGLLDRGKYADRMSPTLLRDKNLDLSGDDTKIVSEYLGKQDGVYKEQLENMIREAPAMQNGTEVVIAVPAYQEAGNMDKTLRHYAELKDRSRFEIVLFENHPVGVERDGTAEIVGRIKREFPDLRITHLYHKFDQKVPIGMVRKFLNDAILLRKQKAGIKNSVAMVSNDADLEGINPRYSSIIGDFFKANPKADAMGGRWDYTPEAYRKYPLLHASQRLWHYLDTTFRYNYLNSPELIGRNSAIRSGTYAAIGGYNPDAQLAEDLEIGWLIKNVRQNDPSRIAYLGGARLLSNPRRALVKMLSGGRLVQQYGDFHVNEDVRKAPVTDLLREKKDFNESDFLKEVQAIYDHYARMKRSNGGWVEDAYLEKSFDRAMRFLGLEYDRKDKGVRILDNSKLRTGLERYGQSNK